MPSSSTNDDHIPDTPATYDELVDTLEIVADIAAIYVRPEFVSLARGIIAKCRRMKNAASI